MTPYFPQLIEDELLYAALGRHRGHLGMPRAASHMRMLHGVRSVVATDGETLVRLRHAEAGLLGALPPRRVTFAELERRVSGAGWIAKRAAKLPRSTAFTKSRVETTEAFRLRRIRAAVALTPTAEAWRIMRAAG